MGFFKRLLGIKEKRRVWYPLPDSLSSTKGKLLSGNLPAIRRALALYRDLLLICPLEISEKGKVIEDHYMHKVLRRPAKYMSRAGFFTRLVSDYFLEGQFFAFIKSHGATGKIEGLLPFMPGTIYCYERGDRQPETGDSDPLNLDRENAFYYQSAYGNKDRPVTRRFEPEDILHIKNEWQAAGLLNGISLFEGYTDAVQSSQDTLETLRSAARYGGGGGLILKGLEEGGPEAAEQLREALKEFYEAKEPFLSLPDSVELAPTNRDSMPQLLQTLGMLSSINLSRLLSVPLELINSESGGAIAFSALKEIYRFWLKSSGRAFLEIVSDSLDTLMEGVAFKFKYKAVLASDQREQAMSINQLVQSGVLSAEEGKEWLRD